MSQTHAALAELLAAQQRRFIAFLIPRVGSQEKARDVLQAALVKALERGGSLRDDESATAWFFRLLRNALIDEHRRGVVEQKALRREETSEPVDPGPLHDEVCGCVSSLTSAVKDEYAAVVRAVDLEGQSVGDWAAANGLTAVNARVRLHRARSAMAQRLLAMCGTCCAQGCTNCPCE